MATTVVNKQRDAYDVYIGRGSMWGNPFKIGRDGDRAQVIALYEQHLLSSASLMNQLYRLKGKRLGCFCKPAACHGDVLAVYAEQI